MAVFHKVVTTLWLFFFVIETAPSPLKPFIRPAYIQRATRPFADQFIYVDKTKHFLNLFNINLFGQTYFFVRPRRFGKSTFLRALQGIFDGRGRQIFNGTFIHGSDYSWVSYPVLYLDFANGLEEDCHEVMSSNRTILVKEIRRQLQKFITTYELSYKLDRSNSVVVEFANVLDAVYEEKRNSTVVLIDEYDLPVLSNINYCPAAEMLNKRLIETLFQRLKTEAGNIKFAFVTGISRAVYRSFSSATDIKDISNLVEFHDIGGITNYDLNTTYADHVADMAKKLNESNVTGILKSWYDGYQFASGVDQSDRLYSPLSVHSYFESGGFAKPYYNDKQHAEFLFDQIVKRSDEFSRLNLEYGVESDLKGGKTLDSTPAEILLYDAGYLSIDNVTKKGKYVLRFPNREMEEAFHKDLAEAAITAKMSTEPEIHIISSSLKKEKPEFDNFMKAVNIAMMKLRMRPSYEKYYHFELKSFMEQANLLHIDVETKIVTKDFGKREPDIIGYDIYTCFLFEIKYERRPCEAYEQVNKSIKTFLDDEGLCGGKKNLLAAGITFSSNMEKDVVKAYQAKLFAPNGSVIERYVSSPELEEKTDTVFSLDNLFIK